MAMSFDGGTVLLIGGAQNIGRAVALEFARRGADIAVADRDEAGRIVIPTHEEVWDMLAKRESDYDAYIHAKLAEFAAGNSGRPQIADEARLGG